MFATLAVVLPSGYKGGRLVVSHGEQTDTFDGSQSSFSVSKGSVFAWYADLQHEVTEVTCGYRVCLVYNLRTAAKGSSSSSSSQIAQQGAVPRPPTNLATSNLGATLVRTLQEWSAHKVNWKEWRFLYLLEHKYSDMGLAGYGLKRRDKVVESMLADVGRKAGVSMEVVEVEVIVNNLH